MTEKLRKILFYVFLFLFITVVSVQSNTVDFDLFARLLQGKAFWQLGNILQSDIFSYTPTHTWFDHEWGASVVFYWVFDHFGQVGLFLLNSLMIFGIFCFAIEALKVKGVKYSTPYNFLFYFFAYHVAADSGYSNIIRCQLFTYLFFAIWFYLLERVRHQQENYWLVTFIPMMLFWSNIHGGCVAGLGLLGLYLVGAVIERKPFKNYLLTIFGCLAIMFANPWGIDYVGFVFKAATMPRILIEEWQPTFCAFNAGAFVLFKIFLFVMLLVAFIRFAMGRFSLKGLDYTKLLVMAVMTYLSLRYTRHQPFFVLSAIVFLYDDFYRILSVVGSKFIKSGVVVKKFTLIKEIFLYGFVAIATVSYFAMNKIEIKINNVNYPVKAIEFIKKNNLRGNLLADFQEGSYIAYKLFPMNLIAMDGRYEEVYPDYMLPLYNNFFMQAGKEPNMLLDKFRPNIIVINHKFPADKALLEDKTYSKAYSDETYSVFVDKNMAKKKYEMPTEDMQYYNDTLFESGLKFTRMKAKTSK